MLGRGERKDRDYESEQTLPSRPPIILAKHSEADSTSTALGSHASVSPGPSQRQPEKPVMVLKPREEGGRSLSAATSLPSIPVSALQGETPPQHTFLQRQTQEAPGRLTIPAEMQKCMKLIDEHQQWSEASQEMLLEQPDFLVVGVVGMQGCGKSTIMSLLAGNTQTDHYRNYVFPAQSRDVKEECGHMTNGIDIYVTSQRIIFLDAQPLLSASVLDQLIRNDKKIPPEYTTAENFAEVQSLQHVMFLLTVCNVVLVVQDWTLDMSLLRFLQTAEMLKPSTPPSNHDASVPPEDQPDYFPHIVFVQNKACREDFSVHNYTSLQQALAEIFATSKLKMQGDVSMSTGRETFCLNPAFIKSSMNLFLLPHMDQGQESADSLMSQMPEYRGYPSFSTLITSLRSQLFSMPREPITHSSLTEKNWFHYSARIWDSIRKSQLIAEYNRLLL